GMMGAGGEGLGRAVGPRLAVWYVDHADDADAAAAGAAARCRAHGAATLRSLVQDRGLRLGAGHAPEAGGWIVVGEGPLVGGRLHVREIGGVRCGSADGRAQVRGPSRTGAPEI